MGRRIILLGFWLVAQAAATFVASAQIEVRGNRGGEWLPIVYCTGADTCIMKNGRRLNVWRTKIEVGPAKEFGEGMVRIEKVQADLDPLRDASPKERSKPGAIAFRYSADVHGETDLEDCFALLVFVANGSVGTHLEPLGRLQPGKPKRVEFTLTAQVDEVARLHIFSRGKELRSNQVTAAYDAKEYWASLAKKTQGVPAIELCTWEQHPSMVLSQDGRRLAIVRDRRTHWAIQVYDLTTMQVVGEVPGDKKHKRITYPTWVSGHEIAFISGGEDLMLMDLEKETCVKLREQVWRIIRGLAGKPETLSVLLSTFNESKTSLYDVRARKLLDKETLWVGWTRFDHTGRARLRYDYADGVRTHYCRRPGSEQWVSLDSTVKQPGLKFSARGADLVNEGAEVIAPGPDENLVYIAARLGSDTLQLAIYDLSKGVITQVIAKHPKYDLWSGDDSRLLVHPLTQEPLGAVYDGDRPRVVWWDAACGAVQRTLESHFPEMTVLPLQWSADYGTFIYYVSGDQDPGTYYVFRSKEAKLAGLFKIAPELEGRTLAKMTPLDFTARDGAIIHGYLTLPSGAERRPVPLVVWVHDGPRGRDNWGYDATNQFLATRGYGVLQVNYRGSSGYGAAYQKAGLEVRLDTVMLDDIADGVRYLIKAGTADPHRIAVAGTSFGGWATYMSLIKYPELYRAGVAISAISHLRQQRNDNIKLFGNPYGYAFWNSLLAKSDFAENEKYIDPLLRSAEIKQPVYIMHGELDQVVHPTQAREMLRALQWTNPRVESLSFPSSSHSGWPLCDRVTRLNEIESFLKRNLRPEEPAMTVEPAGVSSDSPGTTISR